MAQTADGYLWLGGEFGLFRFDRVRFVPWQPPAGQQRPGQPYQPARLARRHALDWHVQWPRKREWRPLTRYPELDGWFVTSLFQDREGTVWAGTLDASAGPLEAGCAPSEGLRGMPERAALIEKKLAILSEVAAETEVELRLPARRAYAQPPTRSWRSRVGAIRCLLLAVVLLGPASSHAQQLTQYAHTAWRLQEAVFDASPVSIAQTTDGFLWIGTLNGLIRFDGARFESWNDRLHELNTCCALSLLGSSDGGLWVGTSAGLAKLRGGKLSAVTKRDGRYNRMIEDRTGRIWAVRSRVRDDKGPLCEVEGAQVRCHGKHDGFGCPFGNALAQDEAGTVWVGDEGKVCSWNNGVTAVYSSPTVDKACQPAIGWLLADSDQSILVGCEGGLRRLEHGRFIPFQSASLDADRLRGAKLLYDRGGGLWVGTATDGLYRFANGVADHFGSSDGLSDDKVSELFEDREGNIWVATPEGIDRFHRVSVVSFSSRQGLRGIGGSAVLASRDGRTIWTTGLQGLAAIRDGRITVMTPKEGLPGQQVTALLEDHQGVLWMGIDQDLFSYSNGRFNKRVRRDGKSTGMVVGMAEDANHSIWIVTAATDRLLRLDPKTGAAEVVTEAQAPSRITSSSKGLVYLYSSPPRQISILHDGPTWEHVPLPTGPRTGGSLLAYGEDSLFVATDAGLYRWRDRQWSTLTAKNGLPCDAVQDQVDDEGGGLWLHLACGFVHISARDVDAWSRDTTVRLDLKLHDSLDGARAGRGSFEPGHGRTANGQLWFANGSVLQMIDPQNLAHNALPPPVHILQVVADGKTYDATSGLRLPPRIRDLAIDYTALSLVAPEKVRFKYRLEGQDRDWREVVNERRVQYSNLPPGVYRFRVIACNDSGVWNEAGDTLELSVAAAYYETIWFRTLAAATLAALLFAGFRVRMRIVERHAGEITALNERLMKAQEQERTRIAGELHDSVMQQITALSLVLGTAKRKIASDAEAKGMVADVQRRLIDVGTEVRELSHDLNPPILKQAGLPEALRGYCDAFGHAHGLAVSCDSDDTVADLSPGTALALYRMAQEALGNAAKHAAPTRVDVRLARAGADVVLTIADDGRGCDPGRVGKGGLGLVNMRERARQLRGTFELDSRPGQGTTVRVAVPFRPRELDHARGERQAR